MRKRSGARYGAPEGIQQLLGTALAFAALARHQRLAMRKLGHEGLSTPVFDWARGNEKALSTVLSRIVGLRTALRVRQRTRVQLKL